jgi:hypothetical protein
MANQIQNIINNVLGDGARSAKFRCFISLPNKNGDANTELDVLCRASSFPGKVTETMEYKHKGKTINIPGQEKYSQTWTLTFYLEENHKNRKFFDEWMSGMHYDTYSDKNNTYINNIRKNGRENQIIGNMGVSQLNFEMDKEVCNYLLYNVYPIEISDVELGADNQGSMLEYTVTFNYTHYDIYEGDQTLNSSDFANIIKDTTQGIINDAAQAAKDALGNTDIIKQIDISAGNLKTGISSAATKTTTSIKNFLG